MSFTISTTRFPEYVQLTVSGTADLRNFVELVETAEQETVYWSDRRLLADLRNVEGRLTAPEQIFLGELVAQNLPHLDRMASVVPENEITRNSEKAAQQLGMKLRVFTSRDEAVAWLLSPVAPTITPAASRADASAGPPA